MSLAGPSGGSSAPPLLVPAGRSSPIVVSAPPALRLPTSLPTLSTTPASTPGVVPVPPPIVPPAAAPPGPVPVSGPPTAGLPLSAASPGVVPSLPSGSGPLGVLMAAIKEAVRGEVAAALGSSGVRPSGGLAAVSGGGTTPSGGGASSGVRLSGGLAAVSGSGTMPSGGGASSSGSSLAPTGITPGELGVRVA